MKIVELEYTKPTVRNYSVQPMPGPAGPSGPDVKDPSEKPSQILSRERDRNED